VVVVAENARTGARASKHVRKKVPSSITFLALERKSGVPSALLEVAEVKAAIGRGYLRIIEQMPDRPVAPVAAENVPRHAPAAAANALAHAPTPVASVPPQSPAPTANAPSPPPKAKSPGKEP